MMYLTLLPKRVIDFLFLGEVGTAAQNTMSHMMSDSEEQVNDGIASWQGVKESAG